MSDLNAPSTKHALANGRAQGDLINFIGIVATVFGFGAAASSERLEGALSTMGNVLVGFVLAFVVVSLVCIVLAGLSKKYRKAIGRKKLLYLGILIVVELICAGFFAGYVFGSDDLARSALVLGVGAFVLVCFQILLAFSAFLKDSEEADAAERAARTQIDPDADDAVLYDKKIAGVKLGGSIGIIFCLIAIGVGLFFGLIPAGAGAEWPARTGTYAWLFLELITFFASIATVRVERLDGENVRKWGLRPHRFSFARKDLGEIKWWEYVCRLIRPSLIVVGMCFFLVFIGDNSNTAALATGFVCSLAGVFLGIILGLANVAQKQPSTPVPEIELQEIAKNEKERKLERERSLARTAAQEAKAERANKKENRSFFNAMLGRHKKSRHKKHDSHDNHRRGPRRAQQGN